MNTKQLKSIWVAMKKSPAQVAIIAFLMFAIIYSALPSDVLADEIDKAPFVEQALQLEIDAMQNELKPSGLLPENALRGPAYTYESMHVTAYNSVPWQTDDTPCIGAQGTDICALLEAGSNTCAANFVPLGTVLDVEGLGTCVVRDRKNARYFYSVDWYMGMDIQAAKNWGSRYIPVDVYAS